MHEHETEIQAVAQYWTARLTGAWVADEQREIFAGVIVTKLRALHPIFVRTVAVGGERPCPILKAALHEARIPAAALRLGVRTRISEGRVTATENGVTGVIAGRAAPAYWKLKSSARPAW